MNHLYVSRPWWKRLGDWLYGYSESRPVTTAEKVYGAALAVVIAICGIALMANAFALWSE